MNSSRTPAGDIFACDEVLTLAARILEAGPICRECMGRSFGKVGRGYTNAQRADHILTALEKAQDATAEEACWVCNGAFARVEGWAQEAVEQVEDIEFATYRFGVIPSVRLEQMEALYSDRFPSDAREGLKHAFNRALGMAFERKLSRPATVDFQLPDVAFELNLQASTLSIRIESVYFFGRYRKLERGIPQTRWPCRKCKGRGCAACDFTGVQYQDSVESIIAGPIIEATAAADGRLHGAGREDIDARMLGSGRPFVLEALRPKHRRVDAGGLSVRVNRAAAGAVEVSDLVRVRRGTVKWVKALRASKRYRAWVETGQPVSADALGNALEMLQGPVRQQTPRRVAHRRADRMRVRHVLDIRAELVDSTHAVVDVHGDGGLYIKELISGDEGRTTPSLAGALGCDAKVAALDVVDVCGGELPDRLAWDNG